MADHLEDAEAPVDAGVVHHTDPPVVATHYPIDKELDSSAHELDTQDATSISSDDDFSTTSPRRSRIKTIGHNIKELPKRVLMRADVFAQAQTDPDADRKEIEGITDNPAFNTGMLVNHDHGTVATLALKPVNLLSNAKEFVKHPTKQGKRKAAGIVTASEHPYLTEDQDGELLEAHNQLDDARARSAANQVKMEEDDDEDTDVEEYEEKVHEIQTRRETLRSAWITSKHVKRARVVRLPLVERRPRRDEFNEYDSNGNFVRWQWEMYVGRLSLWYTQDFAAQHAEEENEIYYSRDELLRQAERLLVASAPVQQYLMHLYKVSRWEDPILTTRWFLVWLFLLKTGYITTFAYWWIVYIVLKNRWLKDDVRFLRESHERAESGGRPYKLSELVNRHGGEDWLEPLLDELGPQMQRQASDLADWLEIAVNFYQWRNPVATMQSLFLWFVLGLVAAGCSTEYGLKIVFFVAGSFFFGCRPVVSKYPRWRKVVSITRWIHWDVPNNAEMAFQGLQEDAQKALKRMQAEQVQKYQLGTGIVHAGPFPSIIPQNAEPSVSDNLPTNSAVRVHTRDPALHPELVNPASPPAPANTNHQTQKFPPQTLATSPLYQPNDILSFRCTWSTHLGRLVLSSTHLRFVRTLAPAAFKHPVNTLASPSPPATLLWERPLSDLLELRKTDSTAFPKLGVARKKKLVNIAALVLVWMDGTQDAIESMRKRDEAFNTIIGFSGLRWSVQQGLDGEKSEVMGGVSEGTGEGGRRTKGDEKAMGLRDKNGEPIKHPEDQGVRQAIKDGEVKEGMKKMKRKIGRAVRFDNDDERVVGEEREEYDGALTDGDVNGPANNVHAMDHTQPQEPAMPGSA